MRFDHLLYRLIHSKMQPRSLGLIVIGNEILNGKVEETNSRVVCKAATPLGLKLMKICAIPDDVDLIAREVREFMQSFDVVLTSGGIGPTHDDVTFEGVARAVDEELYTHPELLHVVETFFGITASETGANDPRLRLARVPRSCELVYGIDCFTGRQSYYPVVKVHNVYTLPGVPNLFRTGFGMIKEHLRDTRVKFNSRALYVTRNETEIAGFLSNLAETYSRDVSVGSYPAFHNSYYRVLVTLDSQNEKALEQAYQEALSHFGSDVISYEPHPVRRAAEFVYQLTTEPTDLGSRVHEAIRTIESALDQYTLDQIVIGFNGGKDCTALLHLVYAVLQNRCSSTQDTTQTNSDSPSRDQQPHVLLPRLLYIRSRSVFPELERFIRKTLQFYRISNSATFQLVGMEQPRGIAQHDLTPGLGDPHLTHPNHSGSLIIFEGPIKSSLFRLTELYPQVRAVFMGTRITDPQAAHLTPMTMTDPSWPQLMRVNPLLHWTYTDVWQFLRRLSLPYCNLYDMGYTSLGSMEDTHPNPSLRYVTDSGLTEYRPAYTLSESHLERSGRRKPETMPDQSTPKS